MGSETLIFSSWSVLMIISPLLLLVSGNNDINNDAVMIRTSTEHRQLNSQTGLYPHMVFEFRLNAASSDNLVPMTQDQVIEFGCRFQRFLHEQVKPTLDNPSCLVLRPIYLSWTFHNDSMYPYWIEAYVDGMSMDGNDDTYGPTQEHDIMHYLATFQVDPFIREYVWDFSRQPHDPILFNVEEMDVVGTDLLVPLSTEGKTDLIEQLPECYNEPPLPTYEDCPTLAPTTSPTVPPTMAPTTQAPTNDPANVNAADDGEYPRFHFYFRFEGLDFTDPPSSQDINDLMCEMNWMFSNQVTPTLLTDDNPNDECIYIEAKQISYEFDDVAYIQDSVVNANQGYQLLVKFSIVGSTTDFPDSFFSQEQEQGILEYFQYNGDFDSQNFITMYVQGVNNDTFPFVEAVHYAGKNHRLPSSATAEIIPQAICPNGPPLPCGPSSAPTTSPAPTITPFDWYNSPNGFRPGREVPPGAGGPGTEGGASGGNGYTDNDGDNRNDDEGIPWWAILVISLLAMLLPVSFCICMAFYLQCQKKLEITIKDREFITERYPVKKKKKKPKQESDTEDEEEPLAQDMNKSSAPDPPPAPAADDEEEDPLLALPPPPPPAADEEDPLLALPPAYDHSDHSYDPKEQFQDEFVSPVECNMLVPVDPPDEDTSDRSGTDHGMPPEGGGMLVAYKDNYNEASPAPDGGGVLVVVDDDDDDDDSTREPPVRHESWQDEHGGAVVAVTTNDDSDDDSFHGLD